LRHLGLVLPLAHLATGLLLAGAPPRGPAGVPLGVDSIPLQAALELQTAGRSIHVSLDWVPEADGTLTAHAATGEWDGLVQLAPRPGGARALSVVVRWLVPAEEQRIALSLWWPGSPSAVGRSLRFAPIEEPLRVERGTPLLVAAGGMVLSGGPGLAAARVERIAGGVRTILYLDDAAARPFSTFETCYERLPEAPAGGHLAWGSFDPRRPRPLAPRTAGQEDRLEASLFPVAEGTAFVPVILERWPAGTRAAVVFTDHADRTDPAALRAALWGDSDPAAVLPAPGLPGRGFLGRGLAITRSFFVHGKGGSLDDPAVRELAEDLSRNGSEVALHSITSEPDTREAVRAGLAEVAAFAPVTWIDHEPYTNCEAISAQGWRTGGTYGIRDLLAGSSIRWIWAAGDEGKGQPRIDDLLGGRPDEARAAIAPFPLDPRLWMFRSSMFYAAPGILGEALSDGALSALEDARGLFVAHTYLGASARTTHTPDHLSRLAVRAEPDGRLVIDPALDAALGRLADHVRAGRLASLTWAQAGARLRDLGEVEVVYLPDGGAEIRNLGTSPLAGLTLSVPVPPEVDLSVDGEAPLGRQDDTGVARVWLDLPAGGRAVLRAFDRFVPFPFLPYP
jgi:hypothetical protein